LIERRPARGADDRAQLKQVFSAMTPGNAWPMDDRDNELDNELTSALMEPVEDPDEQIRLVDGLLEQRLRATDGDPSGAIASTRE
jgi:hypothetical protein